MADQVANIGAALDRFVERRMIALVESIVELLTATDGKGTPRDTGWAAANWIPQIGSARTKVVGSKQAAQQGSVSFGPQKAGLEALKTYRLRRGMIHVTNNVPYIVRLNAGSSSKAPPMFVEEAIIQSLNKVARAA